MIKTCETCDDKDQPVCKYCFRKLPIADINACALFDYWTDGQEKGDCEGGL